MTTPSAPRRDQRERSEQFNRERDLTIDQLRQAREAFERRDWTLAFERLQSAGDLSVADTMALATAAFLIGDADEAVRALQAGYQDRVKKGDALGAVRFAFWLGLVLNLRGEMAHIDFQLMRSIRYLAIDL